jgi:hypothetical protein
MRFDTRVIEEWFAFGQPWLQRITAEETTLNRNTERQSGGEKGVRKK